MNGTDLSPGFDKTAIVLNAVIAVAAAGAMVASYSAPEGRRPRRQGR